MRNDPKAAQDDINKFKTEMNAKGGCLTGREIAALFSHRTATERIDIATRAGAKCRSQSSGVGKPKVRWTW
jgi:hypothetical protein